MHVQARTDVFLKLFQAQKQLGFYLYGEANL
jgi:hypothetical protein